MLRHGNYVTCSGRLEKFRPVPRIPFLGAEQRYQILVSDFILRPVLLYMLLKLRLLLLVHIPWIPFVPNPRNGKYSPVNENPEFSVFIPLWNFKFAQRFPIRPIRAFICLTVYIFQNCGAGTIVFRRRSLPFTVNFCGGFDAARRCLQILLLA